MCTAIGCNFKNFYFGRTLDLDTTFGERVVITPRNFPINFRKAGRLKSHFAIIGMAAVRDGFPLYFDAANEKGLCMAGLNFPGNAHYKGEMSGFDNIAPFELILWVLSGCSSVVEAKKKLSRLNITDIPFSNELPNTPLHWIISDKNGSITVEAVKEGLFVYDNPFGVLTNNPPFAVQRHGLNKYMGLKAGDTENSFSKRLSLDKYSLGLGAIGLPGDFSSESRFVRAAFAKENSYKPDQEQESVVQFFHILGTVNVPKGCVLLPDGSYHYTVYTSCINAEKGIYYYTTYQNRNVTAVDMNKEDLNTNSLIDRALD